MAQSSSERRRSKTVILLKIVLCVLPLNIGDFMIEKQLKRPIMTNTKCLSYPPSLYGTQIITTSFNLRISANYDKVDGLSVNGIIDHYML